MNRYRIISVNKNKKRYILFFLLTLLVLVGIGGILNFTPRREKPILEVNRIEGWKTYENDKYKISFDYPSNWKIEDNTATGSKFLLRISVFSPDMETEQNYAGGDWPTTIYKKGGFIYFDISEDKYYQTFDKLRDDNPKYPQKQKVIIVDSSEALYGIDDISKTGYSVEVKLLRKIINNGPFLIELGVVSARNEAEEYTRLFDNILSSVRFYERQEPVVLRQGVYKYDLSGNKVIDEPAVDFVLDTSQTLEFANLTDLFETPIQFDITSDGNSYRLIIEGNPAGLCPMEDSGDGCGYRDESLNYAKIFRIWRDERGIFALNPQIFKIDGYSLGDIVLTKESPNILFSESEVELWRDLFNGIRIRNNSDNKEPG